MRHGMESFFWDGGEDYKKQIFRCYATLVGGEY